MRRRKNAKGFTLVELIVTLAIMTIILTAITLMMKPVGDMSKAAMEYDSQRTVTNEANIYFCNSVKFAKYAQIYTNCKTLPSTAIADFKSLCGANDTDIKVIALINNFTGASSSNATGISNCEYNGSPTPSDYGRLFTSSSVSSGANKCSFYVAMGKWYYGPNKYSFNFSFDVSNGVMKVKTTAYKQSEQGVSSEMTSKFLNYNSVKMPAPKNGTGSNVGTNTFIIYTNK